MFNSIQFFSERPDENLIYVGIYNPIWVVVSVFLAIFASYVALKASARIVQQQDALAKLTWVLISAFTFGIGTWSMHFIGMLALGLPCIIHYDPIVTVISMIPSILAGGVALGIVWHHGTKRLSPLVASVLLGTGIGIMHFTGMSALRLEGVVRYNPLLFSLSFIVAIVMAYLALQLKGEQASLSKSRSLLIAVILGCAVSGMHYIAMSAAYFVKAEVSALPSVAFTDDTLALLVALTTIFLMLSTLALATFSRNREITAQLRDSNERWNFALEGAGDGVWDWCPQSDEAFFSKRWKEMLGYAETEFPNTRAAWEEHVHPDDKAVFLSAIHNYFTGNQPYFAIEYRMLCKEGTWKWMLSRGKLISRDANGKPLRMIGTHTDISARKQIEESLQLSESKYRTLYDSTSDAVMLADETGFIECNKAALELFGCASVAEFCLMHPGDLSPPKQPCGTNSLILANQRIASAREKGKLRFEWVHQRADTGENFHAEVLLSAMELNGKAVVQATVRDISLRESEARYRAVTQSANEAIIVARSTGTIVSWNQGAEIIFGYTEAEIIGQSVSLLMPEQYRNRCLEGKEQVISGSVIRIVGKTVEFEGLRKDQGKFPLELSVNKWRTSEGLFYSSFIRDLTERKQAEANLRIAAIAFESQQPLVVTDANNVILQVNKAFTISTGYQATEAIGQNINLLKSGRHDHAFYVAMWESIERTGSWQGEIWDRRKNGEIYPKWLIITAVKGGDGVVTHYVGSHADITERKSVEDKFKLLAFYDPLTQIPNRRLLLERLKHSIDMERRDGKQLALLMVDLDRFKAVNDSLGHLAGDELLKQAAARMTAMVRDVDMVARLGGDEFIVLLEDISYPDDAARVADKIIEALSKPFQLMQHEDIQIGASIGISVCPQHGENLKVLMNNADSALYHAKNQGRGCCAYFSEELTRVVRERIALQVRLRKAIEQHELVVFYQPQVDFVSGLIVGAEGFACWQDPAEGLISPSRFTQIVEETNLVVEIGKWALREICRQGREWLDSGLPAISLAVKVSPILLRQNEINVFIAEVLSKTQFPAKQLELEIPESGLMDNYDNTAEILNGLHEKGIQLAIDSFGTGYSSVTKLKSFPLTSLKIDKSFIDQIPQNQENLKIAAAIIVIGHALGLKVRVEGLETQEQLTYLREYSCDTYQGPVNRQPIPAAEFAALLSDQQLNE